jgi:hypothetical protein
MVALQKQTQKQAFHKKGKKKLFKENFVALIYGTSAKAGRRSVGNPDPHPDPLVTSTDPAPDPDPSITKQK